MGEAKAPWKELEKADGAARPDKIEPKRWVPTRFYDSAEYEEFMEENAGEKKMRLKMEEKRKRGEKITARDLDFQKKFQLKTKQMMLKALARYANSLTGSSGLHPPIIMKEDKEKKDDADKKKKADAED